MGGGANGSRKLNDGAGLGTCKGCDGVRLGSGSERFGVGRARLEYSRPAERQAGQMTARALAVPARTVTACGLRSGAPQLARVVMMALLGTRATILAGALRLAVGRGVQDGRGQVEFLLQLKAPLLADGSGADDEQAAAALGPELAEDQAGFDGLAQADFVGQQDALAEGGFQGEQGGVNLVRVQVNGRVEQRGGEAINIGRGPLKRQFMCEIAGVIRRR